ncbi:MAG TPA: MFS transporter [Blastocatellia bacterium]|nr:MFS transporter [Blastocatellia bacterium]HMV83502.1 MFS transporter [Blastocatellia bacterium]HMY77092.1 MFS transporter [Blastocatellia bacterium]HMZ20128.1 MFS transporter [Blastocatellia bacterium]HNG30864.1 MFS transporter [Blastocatellia bacterium]
MTSPSIHAQPTQARFKLLWLIFLLAVITYLDRLCISAAMPAIAREFNLSQTQKGYIFSAFTFAYAAFEIPSGWLGDRFGARLALTRIVTWWSAFTVLTGAAFGFWSLILIRFLFGAGEAGAFPNIARAVSRWIPTSEQGKAMSASFVGLSVGSALTAPIVLTLLDRQSWRWTFVEFGLVGALWCVVWHRWFRNLPEEHSEVNAAELQLIRAERSVSDKAGHSHRIPWRKLFRSKNMVFIGLMYFAYAYGLYFYITWLPTYLLEARGFSINSTKWLASLPWVVSAFAVAGSGWLTDRLAKTGSLRVARCGLGIAGYAASGAVLIAVAQIKNNLVAALLLAVAFGCQALMVSAAWSVCLDVGRRYAGIVTGFMNTVGNIGGAIAPLVVGYAVKNQHSWTLPFYLTAAVFLFGIVMWLLVDPYQPIFEEDLTYEKHIVNA